MCKLANVIYYTGLSQNFHFCSFRAMVSSIGKWQISTNQGANTPEPILTKICIVDYVRDPPQSTLLRVAQRGGLRENNKWIYFFSFFVFFFTFISARPNCISWPIVTMYTAKHVLSVKDVPFATL